MTPALTANLCDSAIADASPRLIEVLNLLGQDVERGYRKALSHLFDKRPAAWFQSAQTAAEDAVQVLNFVVASSDFQQRLTDDKLADLCAFFIGRIKNMEG